MQTCETCRHWDSRPGFDADRMGICRCAGEDARFTTESGLEGIVTRDDFGCIAHEPVTEAVQEGDGA